MGKGLLPPLKFLLKFLFEREKKSEIFPSIDSFSPNVCKSEAQVDFSQESRTLSTSPHVSGRDASTGAIIAAAHGVRLQEISNGSEAERG